MGRRPFAPPTPWRAHWAFTGAFAYVAKPAAMSATLMLWAAFKPSRGSAGSVALEAALVTVAVIVGQLAGSVAVPWSSIGIAHDLWGWLWGSVALMLLDGTVLVVPVSWALGSSERWAGRSWEWFAVELVVAVAIGLLYAFDLLFLLYGLIGLPAGSLLMAVAALVPAALVQRLVCALVERARTRRSHAPRHVTVAPAVQPSPAGRRVRATCVVSLVASVLVSVLALAFFFACRQHAVAEGLELRNVVYLVPTACVLVTCLVVVPIVAVASSLGPSRDYRVAGCAVACALALMPAMLFTSFRLELPEGSARSDGSIEVVTRPWFGVPTVQRALPEGPFFMRIVPDEPAPAPGASPAGEARLVGSCLTSGEIVSLDAEARSLVLAVTNSSCERLAVGDQVVVGCASADHFDVPFEELAVGESVQIVSTQGPADGVIVAQDVYVEISQYYRRDGVPERTLDDILASYGCAYRVTGTVTSAVEEGGFSFRVDEGAGVVEDGTELRVSTEFVERRLYGMKGLQWGMDGVTIGFSDMPAGGALNAKVIVGNDDTSSDYWEGMPPA
ncbi:hypothetical protein [Gordonibacter urolithinfaciens]|uniref:hypothetical protein n=1 Tax=Gordonibacter urolithinfaciens TaxID=1335613 RepID=UPI003AACE266